jgi:hypothetical protein
MPMDGTYTLWRLNVLFQHDQFFTTNKSLEPRIIDILWILGNDRRPRAMPLDIFCLWKQIPHEMLLARKLHVDMTLAQTAGTPSSPISFESINSSDGLVKADKLDIAVQSLTCNTLHDDMNGLVIMLSNDFCVTTQECEDFWAIDGIWDLQIIRASLQQYHTTYIFYLNNAPAIFFGQSAVLSEG